MDQHVVQTQVRSLALTLAVLVLLLPLVLRSLWLGLLGIGLSALPIALTLAVMGWLGIEVNIATCLVGGIALGVAVDDSIYLLSRMQRERRRGVGRRLALGRALSVTGRAMVTTSAILVGGFSTMLGSDFLPSAHFAALFSLAVVLALLADLILVPALILIWPSAAHPRRIQRSRRLSRLLPAGDRACRQHLEP
jgi:uncharacterized protein